MKTILLALAFSALVFGQSDGDKLVTVPKKYVSSEGLTAKQVEENGHLISKASEYVGLGKEIGIAVHEGLSAVAGDVNNFAGTPVGKFTLFMIAFKIIGDRVIHIALGIPLYFIVMGLWFVVYRKVFGGYRYMAKEVYDETTKVRTKTWAIHPGITFNDNSFRGAAGIFMTGFAILWTLILVLGIIL